MKQFMNEDFLLDTETAKTLFHKHAAKMPIIDYHCHINPAEIYQDKQFSTLADAWLGGDHYKWRLMRANGVDEAYITGETTGWEKFKAFAEVLPGAIGNPIYHWAHMELRRFFDCRINLSSETAEEVWKLCNQKLKDDSDLRVRGMIRRSGVNVIVTTDDPVDSLEWHEKLASDKSFETRVLPGWRPDAALNIDKDDFAKYMKRLEESAKTRITDYKSLKDALLVRMEYFDAHGCRASDHGIGQIVCAPATDENINAILTKKLRGERLTDDEVRRYQYALLSFFAKQYARLNWIMEIHFGVLRSVNSVMLSKLGPDTGYDCVDPSTAWNGLARLMDELNSTDSLPKTLIFSINPADNLAVNTLAGCFQQSGVRAKVQQGSAWWFNDTFNGMTGQIQSFAESGVLAGFIGMLTDSRSFLSYTRHEYFRRILCNMLGDWVESGRYPDDIPSLGSMVEDISYNNAINFFNL